MAFFFIRTAILILLATAACTAALTPPSNSTDLAALLAFKEQLKDPLGILAGNWTATESFCLWAGVSCDSRQRVTGLVFSDVQLQGSITPSLGNLSFLSTLILGNTSITGTVPNELGSLPWLQNLNLSFNSLSGTIPHILGNLTRLEILDLTQNHFFGGIPHELHNLRSLVYLGLPGNELSGPIPQGLFNNTPNLSEIRLGLNRLTGAIPGSVSSLLKLEALVLEKNLLSGPVPPSLFNMSQLQVLAVGRNNLSGPIPGNESFHLPMLQTIALQENQFHGPIPLGLSTCQNLVELSLAVNNFTGSVPSWLAALPKLTLIYLAMNGLTGKIPVELSNHTGLLGLDLSENNLEGSIPDSFGNLLSIEELDLSSNLLSGAIPKSLTNLTYLANLNLSFNRLGGQIPEGGVFLNITLKSLMGNNALCGLPRLGIAQCPNTSKQSRPKQLLIKVLLPAVLAFFILAVFLYMMLARMKVNKRRKMPVPSDTDMQNYQLISYHELVRATSNFTDNNLLGEGSFGKVFKGELDDGSLIAIKVLNMRQESASKSFDTECRALRMTRHRNLVRIVSTCSNLDFKALILEYMPHGSLDDSLYLNDGRQLSFLQRVGIMLDVAMALEYLHHQHFEVVLHCDLKPSNILLDKDMIAHVSDFGISKLLVGDENSITLTSMPGTVGYMAPEFGSTGKASRASDIYSFGIVLLEILTRKRPTDPMFVSELSLRQWVSQAFPHELSNVVDSSILQDEFNNGIDDASRTPEDFSVTNTYLASVIELALLCSRVAPEERIPMNDVVVKLNRIKSNYSSQLGNKS
ncbi:hypothetical protein BS78_03G241500 [Paspalum vaginatum]|nr:hypothetical protein BS78_03G241500 [Paspalum vaginatum]